FQVIRFAHAAHAGDATGQWNEPRPAVLETIDADDVAAGIVRVVADALVVREHRRALVFPAAPHQLQLLAEEGVAAGRIHHMARAQARLRAFRVDVHRHARVVEFRALRLYPFARVHAVLAGMPKQHAIHVLAHYLEGIRRGVAQRAIEAEGVI